MDCWVAHDHPERPLGYGAWICHCDACHLALVAATRADPLLSLVAKTLHGRVSISAEAVLAGALRHPALMEAREVFLAPSDN